MLGWKGVVEGVGGGYPTYSMMDVIFLPPPLDSL